MSVAYKGIKFQPHKNLVLFYNNCLSNCPLSLSLLFVYKHVYPNCLCTTSCLFPSVRLFVCSSVLQLFVQLTVIWAFYDQLYCRFYAPLTLSPIIFLVIKKFFNEIRDLFRNLTLPCYLQERESLQWKLDFKHFVFYFW